MISSLPVELIFLILSYLPASDRITLRCVSKWLRVICETPSIWANFEWPTYSCLRDEECVSNVLKWCGEHVKLLSFPDHVTPSSLVKLLNYCSNVMMLKIPTTKLDHEQLKSVLDLMKCLQKLDIKWSFQVWHLLNLTGDHPNLKELTVRVHMGDWDNATVFIASTHLWVKQWMVKRFVPQNINFINAGLGYQYRLLVMELLRVWLKLTHNSPTGHTGFLKYYNQTWFSLYPDIPEFELEFGLAAVLPMVKISHFGVLGLDTDWALVTECVSGNATVHKAACVSPAWLRYGVLTYVDAPILKSVVHFDLSSCDSLLSGHLEQLAINCPNIKQLNLKYSENCLKSLHGIQAIAAYCDHLHGLNILGIAQVENQVQLWQILSGIRLTHLAVDLCVMEPVEDNDRNNLIMLYQKCVSLKALEFDTARYCEKCYYIKLQKKSLLIPCFPFVEFCLINNIDSSAVEDVIGRCKELKYFHYMNNAFEREMLLPVLCSSLQQLCISSPQTDLPDDFMSTISTHGRLVHVVLNVRSMSIEGVIELVENSPDLLTFCVSAVKMSYCQLQIALKEKFHQENYLPGDLSN